MPISRELLDKVVEAFKRVEEEGRLRQGIYPKQKGQPNAPKTEEEKRAEARAAAERR